MQAELECSTSWDGKENNLLWGENTLFYNGQGQLCLCVCVFFLWMGQRSHQIPQCFSPPSHAAQHSREQNCSVRQTIQRVWMHCGVPRLVFIVIRCVFACSAAHPFAVDELGLIHWLEVGVTSWYQYANAGIWTVVQWRDNYSCVTIKTKNWDTTGGPTCFVLSL